MSDIDKTSNVYRNGVLAGMHAASYVTGERALGALLDEHLSGMVSYDAKAAFSKAWEEGIQKQRDNEFYYSE